MAYATQADLETRFGVDELSELTARGNDVLIDAVVVERALNDAQAEIDSYLAGRYALPLDTIPEILVRLCCDIARYYMHDERVTEAVRNRYTDAVRLLRSIATGDVRIDGGAPLPASRQGNEAMVAPPSRASVFRGG